MKLRIFAVRDIATNQFGNPFFLVTKGQAIRGFSDEINKQEPNNMLNTHPEDFELWELGEYDTDTAEITCDGRKQVVTAKELVTQR